MSDMLDYDISISPSPATISVTAAFTPDAKTGASQLVATVASVPEVTFSLTPAGSIIQKIASAIAWPIAQLIAAFCKDKPRDALQGETMTLYTLGTYSADTVAVTPSSVQLGSASIGGTAMVKITATLTASYAAPAQN
ncbi:hypothetical protein [Sphingomonas sp. Leaf242]|uniref:hypothetical protein n=1 Tax=Sphingomonas sp. Leaf242 TaxID=1736304 RepID=UPI0007135BA1|nr:hypothetical protein [Sphingomonas sp. Leaf242]KQO12480.1 hypothetical protein ASF09_19040 [Sphingomonas sp. Leaf242]